MTREMGKLRAKWNTRLEIATRDAENDSAWRASRKLKRESARLANIEDRAF